MVDNQDSLHRAFLVEPGPVRMGREAHYCALAVVVLEDILDALVVVRLARRIAPPQGAGKLVGKAEPPKGRPVMPQSHARDAKIAAGLVREHHSRARRAKGEQNSVPVVVTAAAFVGMMAVAVVVAVAAVGTEPVVAPVFWEMAWEELLQ